MYDLLEHNYQSKIAKALDAANPDTAALLADELEEPEEPLLPQAAMRRAALPAIAVNPTLLETGNNETTSLVGGTGQDLYQCQVRMTVTAGREIHSWETLSRCR